MEHVSITARFPMRTFLGHEPDGTASAFPDTSRLFSALVHAGSKGSLAEERGGDLRMTRRTAEALMWLEKHPPKYLAHPRSFPVGQPRQPRTRSWRDEGVQESARNPKRRKVLKSQSDAVACDGVWGWAWDQPSPPGVVEVLRILCSDVSCLGEADSPVIMELADFEPTLALDADAGGWPRPGGISVRTPIAGRLASLEEDYEIARPTKAPTVASDQHSWGQRPGSHTPTRHSESPLIYRSIQASAPAIPWSDGVALFVDGPISPIERVPWSVALHHALVAQLGEDAAPLLTGKYDSATAMPANRVSIQFLSPSEWAYTAQDSQAARYGAFVVMVPRGANVEDQAQVLRAIASVRSVYRPGRPTRRFTSRVQVEMSHFWRPAQPRLHRLWVPLPGLVAESRPPRRAKWSYVDAALLSLGYVFRDQLPEFRGPGRQMRAVAEIKDRGARAHQVKLIPDSRTELYAHKPVQGMVVQPYSAVFELGDLLPATALCAVGQARHLGGGLLVPLDVPDTVAASLIGAGYGT